MKTFIVLMGPPGAGKGTQAVILSEKTGLPHISSGDIFRENIKSKGKLGHLAQSYLDRGELVPDGITIRMMEERLKEEDCANGAILDGFPRTLEQAQSLEKLLKKMGSGVKCALYIAVPADVLIERLSGRWTCPICGHIYHEEHNPAGKAGICDKDGGELFQREDDTPETVETRIHVYLERTAPLIDYYRNQGVLIEVDGTRSISEVTGQMLEVACIHQ